MKRRHHWFLTAPFLGLGAVLLIRSLPSSPPKELGFSGQQFLPCPGDKRNCVCSPYPDPKFAIKPLNCDSNPHKTFSRLKETLETWEGFKIVQATDTYIHAEFTSRWMKFTDDVECQLVPETGLIHVRSASRIGYWDMRANRQRMETLRKKLAP